MAKETTPDADSPFAWAGEATPQEQFLAGMFDALWSKYRAAIPFVEAYERVAQEAGVKIQIDHLAFRTLALQKPASGVFSIARVFQAVGYRASGSYNFPDQFLSAISYQHPNPQLPKIFISELNVWELPRESRFVVDRLNHKRRRPLTDDDLADLWTLDQLGELETHRLQKRAVKYLSQRPWSPPRKKDVLALDAVSQYAAWVAVHGNRVNHFAALVNAHENTPLQGIEKTVEAMRRVSAPMKDDIEGAPGSKLRQSATRAVVTNVPVIAGGERAEMPWTYAYLEFTERGMLVHPESKTLVRFEGFLGPQARNLFDMTKVH